MPVQRGYDLLPGRPLADTSVILVRRSPTGELRVDLCPCSERGKWLRWWVLVDDLRILPLSQLAGVGYCAYVTAELESGRRSLLGDVVKPIGRLLLL